MRSVALRGGPGRRGFRALAVGGACLLEQSGARVARRRRGFVKKGGAVGRAVESSGRGGRRGLENAQSDQAEDGSRGQRRPGVGGSARLCCRARRMRVR